MPNPYPAKIIPKETPSFKRPDFIIETETKTKETIKESPREIPKVPSPPKITPPSSLPNVPSAQSPSLTAKTKSPELLQIESILEEGLAEVFVSMPPSLQINFKQEGEKTAKHIETLLHQVKVKVKAILAAIRNWLKIIPHFNRYFIEQETKIKTDKIMNLQRNLK